MKNAALFTMKNRSEMKWQDCYTPLLEGFWVEKYHLYQERLQIYDSV